MPLPKEKEASLIMKNNKKGREGGRDEEEERKERRGVWGGREMPLLGEEAVLKRKKIGSKEGGKKDWIKETRKNLGVKGK